jgi:hypothetical protein
LEGTKDKCASVSDIVTYVKSQRNASESYIKMCIRYKKRHNNKFIYIWEGIYWLTKYRGWRICWKNKLKK